ncbi:hypothetical protein J7K74_01475 [Candidatus Woesearchaeota archaeon]|nr:hypothetical protein [Candidatus Woesearchaeota archaeon]
MAEKTIKTGVDQLIELLKRVEKIEMSKAAKEINVPLKTLQKWVDFLAEEGLIGIEYKFTTPYIYLNKSPEEIEELEENIEEEEEPSIEKFKKEFRAEAIDKDVPIEKIPELWKIHLLNVLEEKKEYFYREARRRGFQNIDTLWAEYKAKVLSE